MGYLDKSTITVDAILTKRGRAKLASNNFNITKFALADDEVDYNLWDVNHGKGTNYYGQAIENLPMTEAVPDESKVMRFKLMTLSKNIQKLPFLVINPSNEVFTITGTGTGTITAQTTTGGGVSFMDTSFTAIISDGSLVTFGTDEVNFDGASVSKTFGTLANPLIDGLASIALTGNNLSTTLTKTTTLTIVGGATGITGTVSISVAPIAAALG